MVKSSDLTKEVSLEMQKKKKKLNDSANLKMALRWLTHLETLYRCLDEPQNI